MDSPRNAPVVVAILAVLIFPFALLATGAPMSAEWMSPGGNPARTRRVTFGAPLDAPRVRHEIPTFARESLIVASPTDGDTAVRRPSTDIALTTADRIRWGLRSPTLDVAGDGVLVEPPSAAIPRWGSFLPDVAGLQRLSWTTSWGPTGSLYMHSFEDGTEHPRLVWEVEHDGSVYSPLVVVGDIDGDGVDEVVVSTWHGVHVYEIATGVEKYRAKYRETHARHYGSVGLHTDPSGRVYILVVGDFAGHIASLSVRDDALAVLWYQKFDPQSEQGIDRRFTINRVGPDPMGDFNADGRAEALMNVFNETGDGRWHLLGYDLETGERVLDIPDEFYQGHHDIDGDGTPELLTQQCAGRAVATNGVISARRWNDLLWSAPSSRWALRNIANMPLTHDTGATRGRETVVTVEGAALYTSMQPGADDAERVQALSLTSNGVPCESWRVEGAAGLSIDARATVGDDVLVRVRGSRDTAGAVSARDRRLSVVGSSVVTEGVAPPLVLNSDGDSVIIVADTRNTVSAWSVADDGPTRLWTRPGRAMTTQAPEALGLTAGDIDGDGAPEALTVRETQSGEAELIAYRLDGSEAWAHVIEGYGGRAPVWNEGGVTRWAVGHFLDRERFDVLVSTRRSIMHSDETTLIRGDTHETVWSRDILDVRAPWSDSSWQHTRGYGGGPMAFADMTGDGLDDIVMCYPAEYSVVDGATGEQLYVMDAGPLPGTDGYWVPSGEPLTADFDGDGATDSLWRGPGMILAIRHGRDGQRPEVMWRTGKEDGATGAAALANVDANGVLAVGVAGCSDGFRCYDATTGALLWQLDGRASPVSNALAVDVDGDSRDEFIWADGSTIHAARDGSMLWETETPANVRHLAPITVEGRGGLLAACDDGVVYTLW